MAELADAIEELTGPKRESLRELMPHLVEETSRTPAAGFKVAAIIQRVRGKVIWDAVVSLTVDAGKRAMGIG